MLLLKSQDTHKKKKEKVPATCDPQAVTQEAKQNCSIFRAANTNNAHTSFLWRQEILDLFHALHFTIDQAIEMKNLQATRKLHWEKSKSKGKCSCQPNGFFTHRVFHSQPKYGIGMVTSLNLSFYRPRMKMDFISLKTSESVQGFKMVTSIQAKQSFHNK